MPIASHLIRVSFDLSPTIKSTQCRFSLDWAGFKALKNLPRTLSASDAFVRRSWLWTQGPAVMDASLTFTEAPPSSLSALSPTNPDMGAQMRFDGATTRTTLGETGTIALMPHPLDEARAMPLKRQMS
ncbi:hypothetical protein CSUB01_00219 [Colletotrichum sublineola]|uniref:Uncharacterized protein n=1 Tax=Colletotrichum sublineola TaxID=1173701 RepID=A0A066XUL7_COLSU|nr:hypothetical protein CSUB01_00219 [Colletotrichum sublineola]